MLWQTYLDWFTQQYDLVIGDLQEPNHIEIGPFLDATDQRYKDAAPFGMDWAIIYPDGKYFRVKEAYYRERRSTTGAGVRTNFSFHYGVANTNCDPEGFPIIRHPDTPRPDLRIDLDARSGPHIHLPTEDHIPQSRVDGYSISNADAFQFLRSVIKHRKSQIPLRDLLGIKVN